MRAVSKNRGNVVSKVLRRDPEEREMKSRRCRGCDYCEEDLINIIAPLVLCGTPRRYRDPFPAMCPGGLLSVGPRVPVPTSRVFEGTSPSSRL
jgi:hypothetical protein